MEKKNSKKLSLVDGNYCEKKTFKRLLQVTFLVRIKCWIISGTLLYNLHSKGLAMCAASHMHTKIFYLHLLRLETLHFRHICLIHLLFRKLYSEYFLSSQVWCKIGMYNMAIRVVEFSNGEYKIRMIFA